MTLEPTDDPFAQHVLHSRIVSPEQFEAAEAEQALLSASGETVALSAVLVKQGVLTQAILDNVEKSLQTVPEKAVQQAIGPYRLIRKLGEGGMGTVYLADDPSAGRQVAIKVLPKRYAGNADFLSRFRREAKSAGQLNHPNIVAAYTTGEDRGTNYYVMEYCDGEPLDRLLKQSKRLSWDTAVDYTLQVARGLKHAHDKHIVHRDIKPGNIFITSGGVAKILDMGLSKNIRDAEQSFNTVSGTALGTPHYISPEQAKGERDIDGRTDIYSLGGTLYHLVTGDTPFQGATPAMVMMKHLNEQLSNPQDLCEDVPDGIVQVIRKMMAKEPTDRYSNCAQLIDDLERVQKGKQPINADVDEAKTSIGLRAVKTGINRSTHRRGIGRYNPPMEIKPQRKSSGVLFAAIGSGAAALLVIAAFAFAGKSPSSNGSGVSKTSELDNVRLTAAGRNPSGTKSAAVDATLLFQEDFKKMDRLDALPPGVTLIRPEKLSIEDVQGHGHALKISLGHSDSGVEAGFKVAIDIQKVRGRTILSTVQAFCPNGFVPFHDATTNAPGLVSILEEKGGKPFDTAMYLPAEDGEWKQLVRIVNVPNDAKSLQFIIKMLDAEGDVYFDDFKVEIVPDGKPANVATVANNANKNATDEITRREAKNKGKKFGPTDDGPKMKPEIPSSTAEVWPLNNQYVGLDISNVCNADVISTAKHAAADSFKADKMSCWTTSSWLVANDKKEKKDAGIPDEGFVRIPQALPTGFFRLNMPPAKNAIMMTPVKGKYPKPVTIQLPPEQHAAYSQLAFLHGGSWGDGRIKVVLHYATGRDTNVWLKIEDWHPQLRLPLESRESIAIVTQNTLGKPAEMCAQPVTVDSSRVLESMTLSFDPTNSAAEDEVPHDDRFSAGIFAISGLPVAKTPAENVQKDVEKHTLKKPLLPVNPSTTPATTR